MKKLIAISAALATLVLFAVEKSEIFGEEASHSGDIWYSLLPDRDPVVFTNDLPLVQNDGVAPNNVVAVYNTTNGVFVKTIEHNSHDQLFASVTTNTVVMRVITKRWHEPCACPDGIVGCAVLHTRPMEENKYEIVDENKQKEAQYGE